MNEREWIKSLDCGETRAGEPIDVANRVMRDVRAMGAMRSDDRALGIAAWISAALAAIVLVISVQAYNEFSDPLASVLSSLTTVLQ